MTGNITKTLSAAELDILKSMDGKIIRITRNMYVLFAKVYVTVYNRS